jgi:ATP-dependent Clp protease adaptor protein ClpS
MSEFPPQTATPAQVQPAQAQSPVADRLPPFKVILHGDDKNEPLYVVETICDLTPLNPHTATTAMLEAHNTGAALLLVTHRERAELYIEQFQSKKLSVTMEPAE